MKQGAIGPPALSQNGDWLRPAFVSFQTWGRCLSPFEKEPDRQPGSASARTAGAGEIFGLASAVGTGVTAWAPLTAKGPWRLQAQLIGPLPRLEETAKDGWLLLCKIYSRYALSSWAVNSWAPSSLDLFSSVELPYGMGRGLSRNRQEIPLFFFEATPS